MKRLESSLSFSRKVIPLKLLLGIFFVLLLHDSTHAINQDSIRRINLSNEVFDNLKMAKGLSSIEPPMLRIVEVLPAVDVVMAMADNEIGIIYIQQKSIDICFQLMEGDSINGLAFILGHELAHYIKDHGVRNQFISEFQTGFADSSLVETSISGFAEEETTNSINDGARSMTILNVDAAKTLSVNYQIRKNEAEADLEAGFMCYLAGYEIKTAGPRFLELAYEVYGLRREGGTYVSLETRMEIALNTGLKIDTLAEMFKLANHLSTIGQYSFAYDLYAEISKDFESKAILNNLATLSLRIIMQNSEDRNLEYALPITMDILLYAELIGCDNCSVAAPPTRNYRDAKELLEYAFLYLNKIASIDPHYPLTYLNRSIAYWLQAKCIWGTDKELEDEEIFILAQAELVKAKKRLTVDTSRNNMLSDVFSMKAIINNAMGNKASANRDIDQALILNPSSSVAACNKKIINGDQTALRSFVNTEVGTVFDRYDLKTLLFDSIAFRNFANLDHSWTEIYQVNSNVGNRDSYRFEILKTSGGGYTLYKIHYPSQNSRSWFIDYLVFVADDKYKYSLTSTDEEPTVSISDPLSKMINHYGKPKEIIYSPEGMFYSYRQLGDTWGGEIDAISFDISPDKLISQFTIGAYSIR